MMMLNHLLPRANGARPRSFMSYQGESNKPSPQQQALGKDVQSEQIAVRKSSLSNDPVRLSQVSTMNGRGRNITHALGKDVQHESMTALQQRIPMKPNQYPQKPRELRPKEEASPKEQAQTLPKRNSTYTGIAKRLLRKFHFLRIAETLFIRLDKIVWRVASKRMIADLAATLEDEVSERLGKSSYGEIYDKILTYAETRISPSDIQKNPTLIACQNGIYDIETGRSYDGSEPIPDYFFSLNIPVEKIKPGCCPYYEKFLERTFLSDGAVIRRFEMSQGMIFSTFASKHLLFYMGPANGGKSVVEKFDIELLNDPNDSKKPDRLIMPLANLNQLSGEHGTAGALTSHLVICGDAAKVAISDETNAILKQMSGRDYIRCRQLYQEAEGGYFNGWILLLSNHPIYGDIDDALKSRFIRVPFRSVPENQRIANMEQHLLRERGPILYRFFRELRNFADSGFTFEPISDDEDVVWFADTKVPYDDNISAFVAQCAERIPEAYTSIEMLYRCYCDFCKAARLTPVISKVFARKLYATCPWLEKVRTSQERGCRGIRLKQPWAGNVFSAPICNEWTLGNHP